MGADPGAEDVDAPYTASRKEEKEKNHEKGRQRAREIAIERQASERQGAAKTRTRFGSQNQHRHKHFVRWLLERFPQLERDCRSEDDDACNSDVYASASGVGVGPTTATPHVLDVACGKGELSSRLAMCHNLSVVSVDPRVANFAGCYESLVVPKLPKKWQERIRARQEADAEFIRREMGRRVRQMVTCFDDYSVENSEELKSAIEGSCLLIGLHADSATEAVVDAALEYQKPFVVVPCCVFPRLFASRYMTESDGTERQVRTYEQFCQYLLRKDPRFVMETLPFPGRNVAIWWDGERSTAR